MPIPCPMNPLPATDARCCNPPHFCSATGLLGIPMTMLASESKLAPDGIGKTYQPVGEYGPWGPVRATSFSF
jgi:hypothetical protein